MPEEATFFKTPARFWQWLQAHHTTEEVLWVGYHKVGTGKPAMRWEESVKEALCFGWIDGLRKSIDDESYKIRFTPRRAHSHWSRKNIRMVEELIESNRMQPAGLKAYNRRDESNTGQASYEREAAKLKKEYLQQIKSHKEAWPFFRDLAPGYTKTSVHWVMSAKREKTRRRRLQILIDSCAEGKKIPLLRS